MLLWFGDLHRNQYYCIYQIKESRRLQRVLWNDRRHYLLNFSDFACVFPFVFPNIHIPSDQYQSRKVWKEGRFAWGSNGRRWPSLLACIYVLVLFPPEKVSHRNRTCNFHWFLVHLMHFLAFILFHQLYIYSYCETARVKKAESNRIIQWDDHNVLCIHLQHLLERWGDRLVHQSNWLVFHGSCNIQYSWEYGNCDIWNSYWCWYLGCWIQIGKG